MSKKIKLHSLHFLFQIFSFLADKTGGWKLFVKPKLIIGSLILGLGFTACNTNKSDNSNTQNNTTARDSNNIESLTECYSPIPDKFPDTTITNTSKKSIKLLEPRTTCYDTETTIAKNDSSMNTLSIKTDSQFTQTISSSAMCYEVVDVPNAPTDSNSIYEVAEQMPEYPGGIDSLFKYINSELTYPSNEAEVQGRVICRFVVEKDGSLKQINVVRSLEKSYDKEVVRLIQNMPKWIPGKQNGKVVRVWVMLPVNFKLLN